MRKILAQQQQRELKTPQPVMSNHARKSSHAVPNTTDALTSIQKKQITKIPIYNRILSPQRASVKIDNDKACSLIESSKSVKDLRDSQEQSLRILDEKHQTSGAPIVLQDKSLTNEQPVPPLKVQVETVTQSIPESNLEQKPQITRPNKKQIEIQVLDSATVPTQAAQPFVKHVKPFAKQQITPSRNNAKSVLVPQKIPQTSERQKSQQKSRPTIHEPAQQKTIQLNDQAALIAYTQNLSLDMESMSNNPSSAKKKLTNRVIHVNPLSNDNSCEEPRSLLSPQPEKKPRKYSTLMDPISTHCGDTNASRMSEQLLIDDATCCGDEHRHIDNHRCCRQLFLLQQQVQAQKDAQELRVSSKSRSKSRGGSKDGRASMIKSQSVGFLNVSIQNILNMSSMSSQLAGKEGNQHYRETTECYLAKFREELTTPVDTKDIRLMSPGSMVLSPGSSSNRELSNDKIYQKIKSHYVKPQRTSRGFSASKVSPKGMHNLNICKVDLDATSDTKNMSQTQSFKGKENIFRKKIVQRPATSNKINQKAVTRINPKQQNKIQSAQTKKSQKKDTALKQDQNPPIITPSQVDLMDDQVNSVQQDNEEPINHCDDDVVVMQSCHKNSSESINKVIDQIKCSESPINKSVIVSDPIDQIEKSLQKEQVDVDQQILQCTDNFSDHIRQYEGVTDENNPYTSNTTVQPVQIEKAPEFTFEITFSKPIRNENSKQIEQAVPFNSPQAQPITEESVKSSVKSSVKTISKKGDSSKEIAKGWSCVHSNLAKLTDYQIQQQPRHVRDFIKEVQMIAEPNADKNHKNTQRCLICLIEKRLK